MGEQIKIGIIGYGNLAHGVESAIMQNNDMVLEGVYTRRDPGSLRIHTAGVPVKSATALDAGKEDIDVLLICGGSATDLPGMTPQYAALYNCIDSFDTHAKVPEHFAKVDASARKGEKLALISCGWDPGMFSLNRLYMNAILPEGNDYTFWGRGVSQGHSDAVRRIEGVGDARQYTVPVEKAVNSVRAGEAPTLTTADKHTREVYVVPAPGYDTPEDKERIEQEIKTMPNYFADYHTFVTFISDEEMQKNHAELPHGGSVIRSGVTGYQKTHKHIVEYSLKLDSNPDFTGSVLTAYARAVYRMAREGHTGCITVFDVAPKYLSILSDEEIRAHVL